PTMTINGIPALVELALTETERNHGLMFRPRMSAEDGMLFAYPDEYERGFWMKDTLIPLEIAFFHARRRPGSTPRLVQEEAARRPFREHRARHEGPDPSPGIQRPLRLARNSTQHPAHSKGPPPPPGGGGEGGTLLILILILHSSFSPRDILRL